MTPKQRSAHFWNRLPSLRKPSPSLRRALSFAVLIAVLVMLATLLTPAQSSPPDPGRCVLRQGPGCPPPPPAPLLSKRLSQAALSITVDRTDDPAVTVAGSGAAACTAAANDCSLRGAVLVANANPGSTINIPAGTYQLTIDGSSESGSCTDATKGDLDIAGNNTNIVGAGAATTIVQQTMPHDRVICVDQFLAGNFTFSISGVTITGGRETFGVGGGGIISGAPGDVTNVTNVIFSNNQASGSGSPVGGGLGNGAGGLSVSGSTFGGSLAPCASQTNTNCANQSSGSGGGLYFSNNNNADSNTLTLTTSTFSNNVSTSGNGGALLTTQASATYSVTNSTFTGNVAGSAAGGGGGIYNESGTLTANTNTFTGNQATGATAAGNAFGSADGGAHNITANFNRIVNNSGSSIDVHAGSGATNSITNNWWGCDGGPGATGCGTVGGSGTNNFNPWIVLKTTASPNPINYGLSDTLTAGFLQNSSGGSLTTGQIAVLIGLPVTWTNALHGTLSNQQTTIQASGDATATFTAGSTSADCGAVGSAEAKVDGVQNGDTTATSIITINCPDLTATKTNNATGATTLGNNWTWTLTGANGGPGFGVFTNGQTIITDNLPNTNISYGTVTVNPVSGITGTINCGIVGNDLSCTANGTVQINSGGSFTASFGATPSAIGTFANPRSAGSCAVDPNNNIPETSDANNTCSNSVVVTAPDLQISKAHVGTFTQGQAAQYSLTVSNTGGAASSGTITVTDTLPAGLTFASGTGTGWSCSAVGQAVTCTDSATPIAAAGTSVITLNVNVAASAAASLNNSATVACTCTESNTSNNASNTDTVTVVQVPASITINGSGTQSTAINTAFGSLAVTIKDAGNVVIPGYSSAVFTASTGGSGQSGTFDNATNTKSVTTNGSGIADPGTFTANGTAGAYTVDVAAGAAPHATFNLTNLVPPTITKTFGAATIPLNGTTTLTFNISNLNTAFALTGLAFTDNLPAGLVVATPNGLSNTCGGTPTAGAGSTSVSLTGGTLAAAASCTVSVNVSGTTAGVKNNTTGTISATETGAGATSNTATLTVMAPPTISKSFGAVTIPLSGTTTLSFSITNPNTTVGLTGAAFTDTLPAGLTVPDSSSTVCSGTLTTTNATGVIALTGASIAASSNCQFNVTVTGTTAGVKNNTTGTVSSTEGGTGTTSNTATLTVVAPPTISKAFGAANIALNATTSLQFTIANPNSTVALTGVGFADTLPAGLTVADGSASDCGGTVTTTNATGVIALSGASIAASSTCQFSVTITGTTAGVKNNTTGAVTSANGGTGTTSNTATVTVASPPTVSKAFSPTQIPLNGASTITFALTNPNAGLGLTGVSFSDSFPSGMKVAATPGATSNCGGTFAPSSGDTSVNLSGGLINHGAGCTLTVNVTSSTAGANNNTTGNITSTESGAGATSNTATLTVVAPPTIAKAFSPTSIPLNGTSTLTFTITNLNSGVPLTGVSFNDSLPTGMRVAATPNAVTNCSGVFTPAAGDTTLTFTGGSVNGAPKRAGAPIVTNVCTISVDVTGTAAGSLSNTTGSITSLEGGTGTTSNTANLTVVAPPTISKAFNPTSIPLASTTTLTFTITNSSTNTVAQTGVSFTDTLVPGLSVADSSTTVCGGTLTTTNSTGVISLTGATVAINSNCQFSVTITGTAAGFLNNTTGNISSTNGGTGTTSNTATLAVAAPPTISKSFGAASIPLNGSTTLTFTLTNPSTNPFGLTGIIFTDTFPSGLQVSATPGATNNCGGTFSPAAGDTSVGLTGGALTQNGSCTITVNVKGTSNGTKNNTTGAISSNESGTGATSNTASLQVEAPPTIAKAFSPTQIPLHGTSTLTFTITNPVGNPSPSTGVAFTDNFPAGMQVASTPSVSNTCGGTFAPAAGATSVNLTGGSAKRARGTIPISTCTITVAVTGTSAGALSNTSGAISSTNGGTGTISNTSVLTVVAPPTISKAFNPTTIPVNGTSTLTFTITNPAANTVALSGIGFTDTLPAGMQVAATPAAVDNCGGTFAPNGGDTSLSFSGGSVATGANCTLSVAVTGTTSGVKNNTTAAITSTEGGTGLTSNTATLTVASPPTITKAFAAASVPLNGTVTLTFTIANPNAIPLTGVTVSDSLASGLQVAATPNVVNSCGGTVTATAGANSIGLASGTVAASTNCTLSVDISGTTAGSFSNTTGAITATESGPGTISNTVNLAVVSPPTIAKAFGAASIQYQASTTLTFTITNPSGNTVAETGVAFIDNLPVGLAVATPPNVTSTCGGTVTATAGAASINMTGGTVTVGTSCTLTVNVKGVGAGVLNNTTGAVSSTNGGTGATSNTVSITVIQNADLSIQKLTTPAPALVGSNRNYTVTVANPGPTVATAVKWTDTLPVGLTYNSINAPANWICSVATGVVTCTKSTDMTVNETATFVLSLTVNCGQADGTVLSNTATVSFPGTDPVPSNNSSTAAVTVLNPPATLTPSSVSYRSRGGAGSVMVSHPSTCAWSATSNAAFLAITSGPSGTGAGPVTYTVAANPGTTIRTGTLTIAGQTFTVTETAVSSDNSQKDVGVPSDGDGGFGTPGTAPTVEAGYAQVQSGSGKTGTLDAALNPLYGTAVFALIQDNAVVSEVGVPASPPTTSARLFVDYRTNLPSKGSSVDAGLISVDTGFAIVNTGSVTANLTFTLRDGSGTTLASGHGTLAGGNHRALFIDQLSGLATDFVLPANFATATQFGTLEISSDQPVSVVALRLTLNQRGETLMTTTPVADLTQAVATDPVYFPQLVDGGSYKTTIVLLNTTGTTETGAVNLYKDDGTPLAVHRIGDPAGTASSFNYSLPPAGLYLLRTNGAPTAVNTGSAQVIPDAGMKAPVGAGVFSYSPVGVEVGSQIVVTESGVPAAVPTTHALIYVDRSNNHSTGLAITAPNGTPLHVTLKAFQSDGLTPVGTGSLDLAGNGHDARFAEEYINNLPPGFTGVLDISAPTPFVALTLRALNNVRNEFLLTTFPVADFNRAAPTPILFPQIADGGGYSTQIILLNTGPTPQSVQILYFGDDGRPLDVVK